MRANRLAATAGLRWIGEALRILRVAPLRQLVYNLAFLFLLSVALAIPTLGFALVWLLIPALMVGPHAVARAAAGGRPPEAKLLFAGFGSNARAQLRLGGVYLVGMAAVLIATIPADDGRFAQAMMGTLQLEIADLQSVELRRAMLVGATLQTLLLGALWYSPLLVAWQGMGVLKAVFFSAAAALINWRAFLAYSTGMLLLFGALLMLALVGATLLGSSRGMQANSAMFFVIWILLPVWFASSYLSYRDVFEGSASTTIEP